MVVARRFASSLMQVARVEEMDTRAKATAVDHGVNLPEKKYCAHLRLISVSICRKNYCAHLRVSYAYAIHLSGTPGTPP